MNYSLILAFIMLSAPEKADSPIILDRDIVKQGFSSRAACELALIDHEQKVYLVQPSNKKYKFEFKCTAETNPPIKTIYKGKE